MQWRLLIRDDLAAHDARHQLGILEEVLCRFPKILRMSFLFLLSNTRFALQTPRLLNLHIFNSPPRLDFEMEPRGLLPVLLGAASD